MADEHSSTLRRGLPRLRTSVRVLLRAASHRLDLAALEAQEAKGEIALCVILLGGGIAALFLAGFTLSLLVAALFWDTSYRIAALICLVLGQIAAAAAAFMWARARIRVWRPLPATREQLRKDAACLNRLALPPTR